MPGKYLEYIKAGRNVVPIEITFLSATVKDEITERDIGLTTKWVERAHWKEIKAMLKPAVEAALKFNDLPVEKLSKSTHVSFGQEIGLGYVLATGKDKSPFLAVLDVKKNCWTDDEEDPNEVDENTTLRDYGGLYKNFIPTKVYVSCVVLKKTSLTTEDGKRLRRELGAVNEDVRSYFQPTNNTSVLAAGVDTTPITTIDKVNLLLGISEESANRKPGSYTQPKTIFTESIDTAKAKDNSSVTNKKKDTVIEGLEDATEYVGTKKKTSEDHYDEEIRRWRYERKTIPNKNDSFWSNLNVEGSYYEERDEEAEDIESDDDATKGHHGVGQEHNMQDLYNIDFDDDTFSLPDIDTPIKLPTKGGDSGGFGTHTFNSFGSSYTSHNLSHNTQHQSSDKKKSSPRKKPNHLSRSGRRGSSDDSDILTNELSDLLFDDIKSTKKKRKRANSVKHTNTSINSIGSDSYSGVSFEEAIRAFELRNIETGPSLLTSSSHVRSSPERKKPKDHYHLLGGVKKSPTMSPPRMQKTTSPILSKVSSPVHGIKSSPTKPASPAKQPKTTGSPLVARRIFSSTITAPFTTPTSASVSEVTPTPSLSSHSTSTQKENLLYPEVQVIKVKPKRVRKATLRYSTAPSTSISNSTATNKPLLNQITRIKKEKGLRKESQPAQTQDSATVQQEPTNTEVDPEMPILELMVFNVGPDLGTIRNLNLMMMCAPKTEPLSPCKASSQIMQTPVVNKRKRMTKAKESNTIPVPATTTKKNEATQTVTGKNPEIPELNSMRTRLPAVALSPDINNTDFVTPHPIASTPLPGYIISQKEPTLHFDKSISVTTQSAPTVLVDIAARPEPVPSTSYAQPSTILASRTSESAQASSDDLFSFDHLDKIPPKFTSFTYTYAIRSSSDSVTPSSTINTFTSPTTMVQTGGTMMPPPMKRPPRTPKKPPPIAPVPFKPAVTIGENRYNGKASTVDQVEIRPQLATVGVQVNPSQLTTFELLSNPNLLRAGMGLLTKYHANKMNSSELDKRIGITDNNPPPRKKRSPSPDICQGPPKTQKEIEAELMPAPSRPLRSTAKVGSDMARRAANDGKTNEPPVRSDSYEEDSYLSDPDAQDGGEALVRELMTRYNNRDQSYYEPEGDEFDLSQRSYCMLSVVPDYKQKSRMFKIHSKSIADLTSQNIVEQFQAILPEMVNVFQGCGSSDRHKMYLLGRTGREHLKSMNVCVPFNNDHGMTLITLLFEYFVPDVSARLHWTDYINYVMLPESFIRIYARVNDLTYAMAETEMRYGACYDDPSQLM